LPQIDCGFANPAALVLHGPTLWVTIEPFPGQPGTATPQQIPALIDTGANFSALDDALAQQLQLPIIDQATVRTPAGLYTANVYLGQIRLPQIFGVVETGRFTGIQLQASGQVHRALLGRSLLNGFALFYDGRSGAVILSR
jgi:predicted aspartyl protease